MLESEWTANKRYCSAHETETVIEKIEIDVKGIAKRFTFLFKNIPIGDGMDRQTQSLNIFEFKAMEKKNKDKENVKIEHGEEAADKINFEKKHFYSIHT